MNYAAYAKANGLFYPTIIEHGEHRLKEVAPGRFVIIGNRRAPYIDRSGDHWHINRPAAAWHDNLDSAIADAIDAANTKVNVFIRRERVA